MTLDDIKNMAAKDCRIDGTELGAESIKIPQLHNKYLSLLQDEKLTIRRYDTQYKELRRVKWEYYTGKMGQEELTERGWEPFQLNVLKKDLDMYIESDKDIQLVQDRVAYSEAKLSILEETLKELNTRHWKIRNAIEWNKFTNGGF